MPPLLVFASCSNWGALWRWERSAFILKAATSSWPTRWVLMLSRPIRGLAAGHHCIERENHAGNSATCCRKLCAAGPDAHSGCGVGAGGRSEEHTSELQSRENLVCR